MSKRFFWSVAPLGIVVRVAWLVAVATISTHVHATTGSEPMVMTSAGALGLSMVGLGLIYSAWHHAVLVISAASVVNLLWLFSGYRSR